MKKKQVCIDKNFWEKGYKAGLDLDPATPGGLEALSWYSGYIEGQAAAKEIEKQRFLTELLDKI